MRSRYGVCLGNIVHPTDFSRGSEVAFAHALKLTLGTKGQLEILHVDRQQTRADWDSYPSVRETLSRWGLLPADAGRGDVARLGVNISKSACKGIDTATGVLEHLERRGADLVVMATHQRDGLDRWLHRSLAEKVANSTDAASLFVPYGVEGFVDAESGQTTLKRVLIPIDSVPSPQPVVDAVSELVDAICTEPVEIHLLHIGDPAGTPSLTLPTSSHCRWIWESRSGAVIDCICETAQQQEVDLIAMTTNGHDGFLDAVRGSTTERVLHRCACPVLSVHELSN
ncbi:MAG: universal stress protein [Planctomycetaceae bacterium]